MDKIKFEYSTTKVKVTLAFLDKHIFISLAATLMDIFIFLHTAVSYDNTLTKFEYEHSRAKVKVTVAIFRKKKHCQHSSTFIYGPILLSLHTNYKYENILIKLKIQFSRDSVKVKVAIL